VHDALAYEISRTLRLAGIVASAFKGALGKKDRRSVGRDGSGR
jgi:hypothetical protein